MTVKECYEEFGGDYEEVMGRLRKEERVCKYLNMLLDSRENELVSSALAENNFQEAFLHVHNLKGIALNLSLTPLHRASDVLCEAIRHGDPGYDVTPMLQDVNNAYAAVAAAAEKLKG